MSDCVMLSQIFDKVVHNNATENWKLIVALESCRFRADCTKDYTDKS